VRPAYYGTYTKINSPRKLRKCRRNPFLRARPDTDYDNDSEAEWEEPEEGDEEILSEAEDEADSQQGDGNEDDDFLDDEDDTAKNRRKITTGELVPETTGLCWEDAANRISVVESIETNDQPPSMHGMRISILLPGFTGATIDPHSNYWQSTTTQAVGGSMPPPRAPLQPRSNLPEHGLIGATEGHRGPITTLTASQNQGAKRGPKPAPRTLSKEDMAEFKEAVVDSPLGKLELQKGLKARYVLSATMTK
jgi:chromatin assembly factor 1 subunit A